MSSNPLRVAIWAAVSSRAQAGEALQAVPEGMYFLTIDNASGEWSVVWECRA